MGFDLYGTKVRDSGAKLDYNNPVEGQYFRANVWFWRPLWKLACEIGENILTETDIESGQFNDGHHISEEKSTALADLFQKMISTGEHITLCAMVEARQKTLPLEKCSHCDGTGQRDDEYVQGECNGCEGKGKKSDWSKSYPFYSENVRQFERFCEKSGGFEIW